MVTSVNTPPRAHKVTMGCEKIKFRVHVFMLSGIKWDNGLQRRGKVLSDRK